MASVEYLERRKALFVARLSDALTMYEVKLSVDEFKTLLVDRLHDLYPSFSVDELLVRPREAVEFCRSIRRTLGNFDVPDDMILRPLLNSRKSP